MSFQGHPVRLRRQIINFFRVHGIGTLSANSVIKKNLPCSSRNVNKRADFTWKRLKYKIKARKLIIWSYLRNMYCGEKTQKKMGNPQYWVGYLQSPSPDALFPRPCSHKQTEFGASYSMPDNFYTSRKRAIHFNKV